MPRRYQRKISIGSRVFSQHIVNIYRGIILPQIAQRLRFRSNIFRKNIQLLIQIGSLRQIYTRKNRLKKKPVALISILWHLCRDPHRPIPTKI